MASVSGESPVWHRSFRVTRRPKGSLLAVQALDPRYFQGMYAFCRELADGVTRTLGYLVLPDEIEGALRMWADQADFAPESKLEAQLFQAFDLFSVTFKGWPASPDAEVILFVRDEEHGDEDDEHLA